jgi:hypothetical protein
LGFLRAMFHLKSITTGFIIGVLVSLMTGAFAQVSSFVNTNGILVGYTVQKDGKDVCSDPSVFIEFKGTESYIVCDGD